MKKPFILLFILLFSLSIAIALCIPAERVTIEPSIDCLIIEPSSGCYPTISIKNDCKKPLIIPFKEDPTMALIEVAPGESEEVIISDYMLVSSSDGKLMVHAKIGDKPIKIAVETRNVKEGQDLVGAFFIILGTGISVLGRKKHWMVIGIIMMLIGAISLIDAYFLAG